MPFTEEGGWQVIQPKGRKGRQRLRDVLMKETANAQTSRATSFLDVASIAADHEKLCAAWRSSLSPGHLRAIVSANAKGHAAIRTAVCLGPGSFDVPDSSARQGRLSHNAHVQLEAFRVIVGVLEEKSGHPIKCYAQEPSFGPSDRAYCSTLGIEVVETPDAFRHVAPDAMVFGIHLPHYAWGYALSERLPGMYVGTDLNSLDGLNTFLTEDVGDLKKVIERVIESLEEMAASADRFRFPGGEENSWLQTTFSDTDILWARDDSVDMPEQGKIL